MKQHLDKKEWAKSTPVNKWGFAIFSFIKIFIVYSKPPSKEGHLNGAQMRHAKSFSSEFLWIYSTQN